MATSELVASIFSKVWWDDRDLRDYKLQYRSVEVINLSVFLVLNCYWFELPYLYLLIFRNFLKYYVILC